VTWTGSGASLLLVKWGTHGFKDKKKSIRLSVADADCRGSALIAPSGVTFSQRWLKPHHFCRCQSLCTSCFQRRFSRLTLNVSHPPIIQSASFRVWSQILNAHRLQSVITCIRRARQDLVVKIRLPSRPLMQEVSRTLVSQDLRS
jgi:hypothetical protein